MPPTFSTEYAYQVLQGACRAVGETHEGATLLRLGENAIFRLAGRSSPIVVRVARDLSRLEIARRELCLSRWLNSIGGVPANSVHEDIPDQPIVVDGHPVTFWRYLSVSVEAPADLGVLVPSLRAVEYHSQVYSSIGIRKLAKTVSRMLRRLEATGRAELTSVESIERRADDDRRLRWTVAVGFVSVVAIPISLILAFFGVNAVQVDAERSMFDPAYLWVYTGVGFLVLIATVLATALHVLQTREHRRYLRSRTGARRPPVPAQRHQEP